MIELSVCIATWCRKDDLEKIIEKLEHQTLDRSLYEVIVVDSQSPDGTDKVMEALKTKYDNLVYVNDAPNILASKRNVGIKNAKGDIIIFMDDDVYPEDGFLKAHYDANQIDNNTFYCGQIRFDQELVKNSNYYRFRDEQHLKDEDIDKDLPFNKVVVMNLSFRKKYIETVGYVDENFVGYGCEDMEFGYRIKDKGFHMAYLKDALAIHREKSSSIVEYGKKLYKTGLYGMRILKKECLPAYTTIDSGHKLVKSILRLSCVKKILEKSLLKSDNKPNKYNYLKYKLYLYSMLERGKKDQKKYELLSVDEAKKGW